MERLWQTDDYVDENALTVNVARLRRKLEQAGLGRLDCHEKGTGLSGGGHIMGGYFYDRRKVFLIGGLCLLIFQ